MVEFLKTGITVVSYNHFFFTKRCIESIIKHTPRELYKLCLVDNGSKDETKDWAKNLLDKGLLDRFIDNKENFGTCKAENQGRLWFLEDNKLGSFIHMANDHIVSMNWLEPLRKAPADYCNPFTFFSTRLIHNLDPITDKVFGVYKILRLRYLQEDNEENMNLVLEKTYGDLDEFVEKFKARHKNNPYIEFKCTEWAGAVFYNKHVVEKVGLADEEYLKYDKASYYDIDYRNRLKEFGFRFVVSMQSYVHHWGSITTRKLGLRDDGLYINKENEASKYYNKKWKQK